MGVAKMFGLNHRLGSPVMTVAELWTTALTLHWRPNGVRPVVPTQVVTSPKLEEVTSSGRSYALLILVVALSDTSPGAAGVNPYPLCTETIFCIDHPFTSLDTKPWDWRAGNVYSVLNRQF